MENYRRGLFFSSHRHLHRHRKNCRGKKFKFISSYLMCSVVWNIDNNLNWIFRLVYGCGSNYDLIKMQLINLIEL